MKKWCWALVTAFAVTCPALGFAKEDDPPKKDEAAAPGDSIADRVAALQQKLGETQSKLQERYQKASDDDERQKIIQEFQDATLAFSGQAMDLVREKPEDPATLQAFALAIGLAREEDQRKEVMELLEKHHTKSAGIGDMAYYFRDEAGAKFLRKVVDENPNRDDQAKALFALASSEKDRAGADGLDDAEREKAVALAKGDFETLRDKFADANSPYAGKTFAQLADDALIGLKNITQLVVGKEVPDIEGEDLDGVAFKLSDYRGKVVFLDYWAHW